MNDLDPTKPFTTRSGWEAELAATDDTGRLAVRVCDPDTGRWFLRIYESSGVMSFPGHSNRTIALINVPERTHERWTAFYRGGNPIGSMTQEIKDGTGNCTILHTSWVDGHLEIEINGEWVRV